MHIPNQYSNQENELDQSQLLLSGQSEQSNLYPNELNQSQLDRLNDTEPNRQQDQMRQLDQETSQLQGPNPYLVEKSFEELQLSRVIEVAEKLGINDKWILEKLKNIIETAVVQNGSDGAILPDSKAQVSAMRLISQYLGKLRPGVVINMANVFQKVNQGGKIY